MRRVWSGSGDVNEWQAFVPGTGSSGDQLGPSGAVSAGSEERSRTLSLIDFLADYDARRNPPVYDITRYGLFLLRDTDLPDVPGVNLSPAAEAWLTVDFLDLPPRPPVTIGASLTRPEPAAMTPGVRTPGSQFGLTDEQWATAKDEVRDAIVDAAYDQRMTCYGEVAGKVSVVGLDPHSALMSALLGAVFEDEHEAGRPALTSIVTHKYGDKEPGPGFYDKARALGYRFNEPYIFWAEQVAAIFKVHGKSASPWPAAQW